MVKVIHYTDKEPATVNRLGFMAGEIAVPDDFDCMGNETIASLFEGKGQ